MAYKFIPGDPWTFTFQYWSDAAKTVPIDLTGKTVLITVKSIRDRAQSDDNAILTIDVTTFTGIGNNIAIHTFGKSETIDIRPGTYYLSAKIDNTTETDTLSIPVIEIEVIQQGTYREVEV